MGQGMDGMNESWEPDDNAEIPRQRRNNLLPEKDRLRVEADSLFKRAKKAEEKNKALSARIAELEAALAEARKDADYWDAENGRMLELCRTKLGKRDVHGVADGIEQLAGLAAEAREDAARLDWLESHEVIPMPVTSRSVQLAGGYLVRGVAFQTLRAAIDAARGKL